MKKNKLFIFIIWGILLSTIFVLISNTVVLANPIEDPNSFRPNGIQAGDANLITSRANNIIGIIVAVGVIISAITLGVLGIKYMIGSVEERAEYKKSMIPYLIGAVLLLTTSSIVGIIANIVEEMNL